MPASMKFENSQAAVELNFAYGTATTKSGIAAEVKGQK